MAQQSKKNHPKGSLIIIDDDKAFSDRLAKSMLKRGFDVETAYSSDTAIEKISITRPDYAVLDLRIGNENGIALIEKILKIIPHCSVVILTAFGSIATAVAAIKSGAIDYLSKPSDAETIENALLQKNRNKLPPPPAEPMTAERVRWEHIQRIYEQCGRNISETARRLRMHRRTLQRILSKYPPRDNSDD
jgi:two-component system response regulator RegA